MSWLAAKLFLKKAWSFLGDVPRWVWITLGVLLLVWVAYHKGVSNENDRWVAKLEHEAAQVEIKAANARASADKKAQERATEFEAQQEQLEEVIEDARNNGDNPLDALLGGL